MSTISYGTKYAATKDLNRVEIAKLIRADIKAAVANGSLPKASYSVKTESYAGGGSINVRIANVEKPGFVLANADRIRWDHENPHAGLCGCPSEARWLYSGDARELLRAVDAIMGAYNYDGSDIQSDYFNVRFYGHAEFSHAWADERIASEKPAILGTVTEPAPANDVAAPEMSAQESYLEAMGAI